MDGIVRSRGSDGGALRATECACRPETPDRQACTRRRVKHSPGFLKLVDDAKSRVREVSVDEARRKLGSGTARVIDVREESEWAAGHIRGAVYLGKGVLERDIELRVPNRNAELILYC